MQTQSRSGLEIMEEIGACVMLVLAIFAGVLCYGLV
jgi:hypothetical protein